MDDIDPDNDDLSDSEVDNRSDDNDSASVGSDNERYEYQKLAFFHCSQYHFDQSSLV